MGLGDGGGKPTKSVGKKRVFFLQVWYPVGSMYEI